MASLPHPIAWYLDTLRRRKVREIQQAPDELAEEGVAIHLGHRRDATFRFLPPPC
jgi:hypothetical protein